MKHPFLLMILILCLMNGSSLDGPIVNINKQLEATVTYKSVSGFDANLNSLDIYYTSNTEPKPVVIWVHGGAWVIGDKKINMNNKIALFREEEDIYWLV